MGRRMRRMLRVFWRSTGCVSIDGGAVLATISSVRRPNAERSTLRMVTEDELL
jgi:hypothetical protein